MDTRNFCAYNLTRDLPLSSRITVADSVNQPLKILKVLVSGLALDAESGLWLVPLTDTPSVPRLVPFDLVYLDKDQRVIQGLAALPGVEFPPFSRRVASALVLPVYTMATSKTMPGDRLIVCLEEELERLLAVISAPPPKAHPEWRIASPVAASEPARGAPAVTQVAVAQSLEASPMIPVAPVALNPTSESNHIQVVEVEESQLTHQPALNSATTTPVTQSTVAPATESSAPPPIPVPVAAIPSVPVPGVPTAETRARKREPSPIPVRAAAASAAKPVERKTIRREVLPTPIPTAPVAVAPLPDAPLPATVDAVEARSAKPEVPLTSVPVLSSPAVPLPIAEAEETKAKPEALPPVPVAASPTAPVPARRSSDIKAAKPEPPVVSSPMNPLPATQNIEFTVAQYPIWRVSAPTAVAPATSGKAQSTESRPTQETLPGQDAPPTVKSTSRLKIEEAHVELHENNGAPVAKPPTQPAQVKRMPVEWPASPEISNPIPKESAAKIETSAPETAAHVIAPAVSQPAEIEKEPQAPTSLPDKNEARPEPKPVAAPPRPPRWPREGPAGKPAVKAATNGKNGKADSPGEVAKSLRNKLMHWFKPEVPPTDRRRARRRYVPGMVAYYFTGGAPRPHQVADISATGFYLLTEDRWIPETMIQMTLQRPSSKGQAKRSIAVLSKIVRKGADGVGTEFVMAQELDHRHTLDIMPKQATDKHALTRFL